MEARARARAWAQARAHGSDALLNYTMVGVGVAEGGGAAGGESTYYGEYYPDQYYVPPEMCTHPHHPHHPHMCTLHADYSKIHFLILISILCYYVLKTKKNIYLIQAL